MDLTHVYDLAGNLYCEDCDPVELFFDSGRIPSLPYKRLITKKGNFLWYEYVYDEYYDYVLCPQDKILSYATTNREGYWEYKSESCVCKSCPVRECCTQSQQCTKTVTRHVWHDYIEPAGRPAFVAGQSDLRAAFADD